MKERTPKGRSEYRRVASPPACVGSQLLQRRNALIRTVAASRQCSFSERRCQPLAKHPLSSTRGFEHRTDAFSQATRPHFLRINHLPDSTPPTIADPPVMAAARGVTISESHQSTSSHAVEASCDGNTSRSNAAFASPAVAGRGGKLSTMQQRGPSARGCTFPRAK